MSLFDALLRRMVKRPLLFNGHSHQGKQFWLFLDFPKELYDFSCGVFKIFCFCIISVSILSIGTSTLIKNCVIFLIRISQLLTFGQN